MSYGNTGVGTGRCRERPPPLEGTLIPSDDNGSDVNRRWLLGFGALLVAASVGVVLVAGGVPPDADVGAVLTVLGLSLTGLCFVLAGLRRPPGMAWYRYAGAGIVLVGLAQTVRIATSLAAGDVGDGARLVGGVAGIVGGLVLVVIGLDWFRGGRHFDLGVLEG